ncbi:TonB-dependent receptor plug domain-containing protein [Parasphingopyxis marina]|uniref:TonB-dependent receptor n=1 Tax=Parasphingopyxis marina TaxID=2761622 RepID=A0A842HSJ2_9SPHN|nr:TonB-dependent receptor [Parasphingopyxis marina]MBC2776046.1 TonB-dependent receptor [Parasphingopyxis marina]
MSKTYKGTAFSARKQALRCVLMGGAAGTFIASPALAQDELASADQPAIVVTGSRITNPNLEQSSPVQVVGQDEIDLRQATNAEELIGELPGIVPGLNNSVNNGSTGIGSLNLRGLGSTRNLILLDGNRIVPATLFSQTDLNVVPVALVERVEVVTGGASSVYGADAITGVANFVTRRDFEGVEAAVSYGITERGDGERLRGDLTIGANFDGGRGNAVLSIGYQEVDDVLQSNRLISQNAVFVDGSFAGSATGVPTRITSLVAGGGGVNQINSDGTALVPTYSSFNYAPFNYFQTPLERYNIYGAARYEVTPDIEAYTRAMFTKTTVSLQLAPSGLFGDTYIFPLNNPFINETIRQQICASPIVGIDAATCTAAGAATDPTDPNYLEVPVTINRRLVEQGARNTDIGITQFQVWAGLRGNLSETIEYDVSASYGESDRVTTRSGWGLKSRVQQALRALDATNCVDPSNGCYPINLFGGGVGTNIDPQAVAFFNQPSSFTDTTSLATVNASINGELGESGLFSETPIGFAVGVEYREYNASRVADVSEGTQDEVLGTGAPSPTFAGQYDVIEGFAELIVPIVEDTPGFYSLTAEGGIRVSDYSNTGTSVTWKAGGTWEPFEGFRIRGIYQRAVRSPNIGELFLPVTTGLTGLTTDPCAGTNPVGNATLTAICIAQGAPAALIGTISQPSAAQANLTTGGNPDLDPEVSDSYTIGVIVTPRQVPGLALTIDYYDIIVNDAITTRTPGDVLNPCYGPNGDGNGSDPTVCSLIIRNPLNGTLNGGGDTPGLAPPLTNQGRLHTSGVDFRIAYNLPVSFGSVNFDLNGNWTERAEFRAVPGGINRDCIGLYSSNCDFSTGAVQPEWSFNFRTTLSVDDLVDVSLLWRWIDGVEYEFAATTTGILPEFLAIDDASYFDLSVRSNVSENFDVTFSIFNLLDRDPPNITSFLGTSTQNSGNTFPSTYDALGRRYSVTGRIRF